MASRRTDRVLAGDRVEILVGDEKGGWGIIDLTPARYGEYHVRMYGSGNDVRVFKRSEIRKPRRRV